MLKFQTLLFFLIAEIAVLSTVKISSTVWSPVLGRVQLLGMFHCFALIVNSLINWKLKLYRYSVYKVSKTQCMQFQPSARIRILENLLEKWLVHHHFEFRGCKPGGSVSKSFTFSQFYCYVMTLFAQNFFVF